jgi:hypothetical protein
MSEEPAVEEIEVQVGEDDSSSGSESDSEEEEYALNEVREKTSLILARLIRQV